MTAQQALDAILVMPSNGQKPRHLLVMLHGWGANYQDLAPLAQMLDFPGFAYLFPNAPFDHPQVPGGRAWYDLENMPNCQQLPKSRELLINWLSSLEDSTGVPIERTIMAGFSQGGAMTLDVGLTFPCLGLVSMSGYLHYEPDTNSLAEVDEESLIINTEKITRSYPSQLSPTLIIHGKQDPVVPIAAAREAQEKLTAIGVAIQYHEFNMGHEIPAPALEVLKDYISVAM
ncbi:putative esterase [Xenococcus sp. PCC 7305]|uniref:alpha/beta hydrolase n=1 Tax=Xenococcus sp. PCC 7305 TaxID=102125 RepID=UPI0002ACAC7C|nr:PHB depolymerase family esterase [Xenococcus sp. PCC 7305]ELS02451.1 putative esterase [Xenococcus sp. PCC 7305]